MDSNEHMVCGDHSGGRDRMGSEGAQTPLGVAIQWFPAATRLRRPKRGYLATCASCRDSVRCDDRMGHDDRMAYDHSRGCGGFMVRGDDDGCRYRLGVAAWRPAQNYTRCGDLVATPWRCRSIDPRLLFDANATRRMGALGTQVADPACARRLVPLKPAAPGESPAAAVSNLGHTLKSVAGGGHIWGPRPRLPPVDNPATLRRTPAVPSLAARQAT